MECPIIIDSHPNDLPLAQRILEISRSDLMVKFFRYWSSCIGEDGCVDRRNIDPLCMKEFLPCLFMGHREGKRFRYDLVGTTICEANGRDLTGMFLDEFIGPAKYREVFPMFEAALR